MSGEHYEFIKKAAEEQDRKAIQATIKKSQEETAERLNSQKIKDEETRQYLQRNKEEVNTARRLFEPVARVIEPIFQDLMMNDPSIRRAKDKEIIRGNLKCGLTFFSFEPNDWNNSVSPPVLGALWGIMLRWGKLNMLSAATEAKLEGRGKFPYSILISDMIHEDYNYIGAVFTSPFSNYELDLLQDKTSFRVQVFGNHCDLVDDSPRRESHKTIYMNTDIKNDPSIFYAGISLALKSPGRVRGYYSRVHGRGVWIYKVDSDFCGGGSTTSYGRQ